MANIRRSPRTPGGWGARSNNMGCYPASSEAHGFLQSTWHPPYHIGSSEVLRLAQFEQWTPHPHHLDRIAHITLFRISMDLFFSKPFKQSKAIVSRGPNSLPIHKACGGKTESNGGVQVGRRLLSCFVRFLSPPFKT